jgi:DNA polymerase-3 subunit chi
VKRDRKQPAVIAPAPAGFERVLEVVPADPAARAPLRERWKHYAALGLTVTKHDM